MTKDIFAESCLLYTSSSRTYMQSVIRLFDRIRSDIGWDLEIMHDIHERLSLADTLSFVKELEQFKPFFIEDALPPEEVHYFEYLRKQTVVPLAMGELFTHPVEWKTLVQNQWIDFIRCHLSDIGGLTPEMCIRDRSTNEEAVETLEEELDTLLEDYN